MERLTERTALGILVKENYEKESLKTLYSCYGEKPNSIVNAETKLKSVTI